MDGGGSEGGGEEGQRRPWGEVDDDDNDDDGDDDGGPFSRARRCRPLADVRGDDGMIGGLLEKHHR